MKFLSLLIVLLASSACGDDDTAPDAATDAARDASMADAAAIDAGEDATTDATTDIDAPATDASTDASTDAGIDAPATDAGPIECAFNRECPGTMRCECDEATGCSCAPGDRGEGTIGDSCATGNECASSVCLEGPGDALMCSEECAGPSDCRAPLPVCADIAFVGRICVRMP